MMDIFSGFEGAIFDLDGTLVDSSHVWSDIDRRFLEKRGFEVPEDYAKRISCLNFYEGARYTIERFGLNEEIDDIVEEWFAMAIDEYSHHVRIKKGAAEFLRQLREGGTKIALATASSPRLYIPALKNNGVYEYFDAFASTEEVCRSKEHGDVYILAAGKLGCSVRKCVVFEDICEGVCAAKECGFYVCACLDGSRERDRLAEAADVCFCDYKELLDISL